jgi:hypothetical protein
MEAEKIEEATRAEMAVITLIGVVMVMRCPLWFFLIIGW